ncbi:carbohydrate-binding module family 35 protein [Colletotrichum scovillei]|uniref:Carbohydrate-binding module family 35 protein n=1 Tax=Colletotrichum scovillei TaxID=1209932 RepID=A0A9P7QR35_9PEZI|nr:carbohydrate-binding module family 35 protein [Colletotrichum scovillei]KAG7041042.1 carbohydrate-binding module family 35 protein [Colletotrichum scovillei]KAG7061075.1 carbohydrate-binding module family 35 protein [Colletotrichum scovillei]
MAKRETNDFTSIQIPTNHQTLIMPFFYSKPIGGRNFGTSVHADRHGVHRGPWRMRIGRFNCFR